MRGRSTSPIHYSDNERTRSQSPADSFYHSDSSARASSPDGAESPASHNTRMSSYPKPWESKSSMQFRIAQEPRHTSSRSRARYKYTPLLDNEVRLLRISPGPFGSRPFLCSLKIVPLDKLVTDVHEFQALSYAWGKDVPTHEVFLNDLPRSGNDDSPGTGSMRYRKHLIRENLYKALDRIRLTDDYLWLWVDDLCIEQKNQSEKSQQIPKMPDIYSSAWNVIAWLGDGYPSSRGVSLVPDILNLRSLDIDLRGELGDQDMLRLRAWVAFGRILQRPCSGGDG